MHFRPLLLAALAVSGFAAAADDPDLHVLMLPADANRTINALQRRIAADLGFEAAQALFHRGIQ